MPRRASLLLAAWLAPAWLACTSPSPSAAPPCPSASASHDPCDLDRDSHRALSCGGDDCDDSRADIHPLALDACDGDDNDCDGTADNDDACDCASPPPDRPVPFSGRVCLKGGWFLMGMGQSDPDAAALAYNCSPIHPVFVSPLYLEQYEVTNERYLACVEQGGCWLEKSSGGATFDVEEHLSEEQRHRPFNWANVRMAEAFCQWQGGRLPTEAEWERAAVGLGDKPRPYVHGFSEPSCETDVIAECFADTLDRRPQRVGTKPPNPEGLYDLGGNSSEFVRDAAKYTAYKDCKAPCKNPCVDCETPLLPPSNLVPAFSLFVRRGMSVDATFAEPNLKPLFRAQARDQQALRFIGAEVFPVSFRCAYPAKPKR